MRQYLRLHRNVFPLAVFIFALLFQSCADDPAASIYDPNTPVGATPTIAAISVEGGGGLISGVSIVVIDGTNFTADSSKILVFFDAVKVAVLSTTPTKIRVKAPTMVKDSVNVRISIQGSENFNVAKYIDVKFSAMLFGNFTATEEAYGIACDKTGNVYAGMLSSGLGIGIRKYTSSGDTSSYAPKGLSIDIWSALKIGPAGVIYACRNQRAMYTISAKGSPPVLFVAGASTAKFYDLDFDKNLNIWTGGADTSVYKIKPDKSITTYSFKPNAEVRSVRVYSDFLYLGGKVDSTEGVWRASIDASGNLGTFTKFFDLTAQPGYGFNGPGVYAITFNTDGDMYVGTNSSDAVLIVKTGSSASEPFYPGLFSPQSLLFAWGEGSNLYITRRGSSSVTNSLVKVNTQKQSAPYYGRGDL